MVASDVLQIADGVNALEATEPSSARRNDGATEDQG
jgi:hypothetical protein